MKRTHNLRNGLITVGLALSLGILTCPVTAGEQALPNQSAVPYGRNLPAGHELRLNGIRLYFETYGKGPPMLLLHGNGQSISAVRHQIAFFSAQYRVVAPDNRGHGQSQLGEGRLTYEQMAEDMNALLDELNLKQVCVLGWSDGGILGLLLAINHPDKVGKLAIMGANLNPAGAYDWARTWVAEQDKQAAAMLARGDTSQPWPVYRQYFDLLGKQPNIEVAKLKRVSAPTLVMAGDKDVIRDEHTIEIFHALPKAHLCIFPGATHMIPEEDPELFNRTVERFFREPFKRPDTKGIFSPAAAP